MINLITKIPNVLRRYLAKFRKFFSKRQFKAFSTYVSGLLLQHKRTSIDSIARLSPRINYQSLQYFLSESKFDCEEVNERRVELLQRMKPKRIKSSKGVLAIDDTSCKKWGTRTEGAKPQYSSTEKRVTNCNVVVLSGYCAKDSRYPINLRPYKPMEEFSLEEIKDFKSKIELAMDLVDDAWSKDINFSDVIFDSWYFSKDLIERLKRHHLPWITEPQGDRRISYLGKWTRADELVKLIPSVKFKEKIPVVNSQGKKKSLRLYSYLSKIKNLKERVRVVVVKGSWETTDPEDTHIFVTNYLSLDASQIVERYLLRWGIECLFRDMKENVGFDQYQVRSLKSISRHWHLAFVTYSFLLWTKITGFFRRIFSRVLTTIGDFLRAFRKFNSLVAEKWISANRWRFYAFLGLKPLKTANF